ncbi:transcriptional regulator TyrR [Corallincola platygyrae]|uniref:HTH-type transcriptional regulatory protein TyrR n=1 Tax=Corallincola platygyrae TaxID=1193278 RepID=A0ABW4XRF8_9GAMM
MRLEVVCEDRLGIAQEVLVILVKHGINLKSIETDQKRNIFLNFPGLAFEDLQKLMPALRLINGVEDVRTVPYTPSERGHYELETLLRTLPDPVFSIDLKCRIVVANEAAAIALRLKTEKIVHGGLNQWVHGFSFQRWMEGDEVIAQAAKITMAGKTYLADILPIRVPDLEGQSILAGAVVVLKSVDRLGEQVTAFQRQSDDGFSRIFADSAHMKRVLSQARKMAQLDAPLLIHGETGTGKELLARACHEFSFRGDRPFIALNCASLPDNVAEHELFGFSANAFEGAGEGKRGVFEQANGGTVFLDEIGDMSEGLQVKFLRFLQDGSFRRVGAEEEVKVSVRVICATQKDLPAMVQQGEFREDLYYRLNVLNLRVPALRERKADIVPLAELFVARYSRQLGRPTPNLTKQCQDFVQQYPWPGNVRQLENSVYQAVSLLEGHEIDAEDLQLPSYSSGFGYYDDNFEGSLEEATKRFESNLLRRLYPAYPSTRQLARKLGVSHTAIANKLREYGINKKSINNT